jgi:hypothetical protein
MFAITLVPATLAAGALMAFHHPVPAYAAPCPTVSASPAASAGAKAKATPTKAAPNKPPANKPPAAQNGAAPPVAAPTASPTPAATSTGTGNPFVDGWNNFVDGVKKLFGGGDSATPAASPSASASPSTGTGGTPGTPGPPDPTQPSPSGSDQPPASATPSVSSVPCLGPGVIKKAAADPGVPKVAAAPAVLTGAKLTMYDSTYDGVADLDTAAGPVRALKFSMSKAVTTPFQLKVSEPNGKTTVITSPELTTKGNVKFYTPKFTGRLFGLIPVTFTPESPPPLTLPILIFTDVTIDLAFVQCDTLSTPEHQPGEPPTLEIHER